MLLIWFRKLVFVCTWLVSAMAVGEDATSLLFDGETLNGWTLMDGSPVTGGWEVIDGAIRLNPAGARTGSIITNREFADFELSFAWRIEKGTNSGLKYRVRPFASSLLGCEYQILDDLSYPHFLPHRKLTGSLYSLYQPNDAKLLRPVGELNSARIVAIGDRIEHWMNGQLILQAEVGSPEWQYRLARSKFSDHTAFGAPGPGRIILTDHGGEIWYRDFRLTLIGGNGDKLSGESIAPPTP